MPNKFLAPLESGTQDDPMTTKKNIRLLTIVALLLACIIFGVCGCKTELMGKVTEGPTPTPIGNKASPGKITE